MKTKEKLGAAMVQQTLDKLSEGINPVIENLDVSKLSAAEKQGILDKLDELEAKALEVRENFE